MGLKTWQGTPSIYCQCAVVCDLLLVVQLYNCDDMSGHVEQASHVGVAAAAASCCCQGWSHQ
jgi:hypothetical protein